MESLKDTHTEKDLYSSVINSLIKSGKPGYTGKYYN